MKTFKDYVQKPMKFRNFIYKKFFFQPKGINFGFRYNIDYQNVDLNVNMD